VEVFEFDVLPGFRVDDFEKVAVEGFPFLALGRKGEGIIFMSEGSVDNLNSVYVARGYEIA